MFQRIIVPPSSGEYRLIDPEGESTLSIQNVSNYVLVHMVQHHRILEYVF